MIWNDTLSLQQLHGFGGGMPLVKYFSVGVVRLRSAERALGGSFTWGQEGSCGHLQTRLEVRLLITESKGVCFLEGEAC